MPRLSVARWRAKCHRAGFVYFIGPEAALYRREDGVCVKIGYTAGCPLKRMHALQAGSPQPLEMLAYFDGTPGMEKAFHEAFATERSHREWFYLHSRLWAFLMHFSEAPPHDRYVSEGRLCDALTDNLAKHQPVPHPAMCEETWARSVDPAPLLPFFPELAE